LACARGLAPRAAAAAVGCSHQSVRNALDAFRAQGLASLRRKRAGPSGDGAWPRERDADLLALLRRSPREFGRPRRWWTLALLAEVCFELGWCSRVFCGLTVRHALERQGVAWKQAKRPPAGPAAAG
jgi:transposase